ncbi:hypothetical protein GCM10010252_24090 [Streptomyces aureoverticillatus]|nr:hypothetical protein GCM10010252_24090 [Streptomyces aureoverticillatus]
MGVDMWGQVRARARLYVAWVTWWMRWERPGRTGRAGRLAPRVWTARQMRGVARDAGMVTSEYAMGLIATVAFAGLLFKVVTSGPVKAALQAVVESALDVRF